jgi:hypothetical protein
MEHDLPELVDQPVTVLWPQATWLRITATATLVNGTIPRTPLWITVGADVALSRDPGEDPHHGMARPQSPGPRIAAGLGTAA